MTLEDFLKILGALSIVVGAGTAYLRLFVATQIAGLRDDLHRQIQTSYVPRELAEAKFQEIYARLDSIEQRRRYTDRLPGSHGGHGLTGA